MAFLFLAKNMAGNVDFWVQSFRSNTTKFEKSFGHLSGPALNWKPAEDSWSVGQVIDHIIRINESYYPIFDRLAKNEYSVPLIGHIPGLPSYFGNFLQKSLSPDRKKKIRTFAIWEPSKSNVSTDIVKQFREHHERLCEILNKHRAIFFKGTVISSPANRYFVYPLDMVPDILITHEERHYNQAIEVLAFQKGTEY